MQTSADIEKWPLSFGTLIDNPLIQAQTDNMDNRFKNGKFDTIQ